MKIKNDFSSILESYFSKHLKLERKFSINTYDTYLTVLKQFINYLSVNSKIKITKKVGIIITSFGNEKLS